VNQTDRVLSLLRTGRCLSAIDGLRLAGTARLAARIYDLRLKGWDVQTRLVSVRGKFGRARIAIYRLKATA
jgi:hypothetical protein